MLSRDLVSYIHILGAYYYPVIPIPFIEEAFIYECVDFMDVCFIALIYGSFIFTSDVINCQFMFRVSSIVTYVYFYSSVIIYYYCFLFWGRIYPSGAQGFLLALRLGITLGCGPENIGDAGC